MQNRRFGRENIFCGKEKYTHPKHHDTIYLYQKILLESISRLNKFAKEDCPDGTSFLLIIDEHPYRKNLLVTATKAMYEQSIPIDRLIEPPFQAESQYYQTLQAADWIAALIGRMEANRTKPDEYADWFVFREYFDARIKKMSVRSGIHTKKSRNYSDP